MEEPQEGDLILHSLKSREPHRFWGFSVVTSRTRKIGEEPPVPGRWKDHSEYYQIPLSSFTEFDEKKSLIEFYAIYKEQLNSLPLQKSFYTESGSEIKTVQKYLAKVSPELFVLVSEYLSLDLERIKEKIDEVDFISRPGDEESIETKNENGAPSRVETTVNRIVRDTKKVKELKRKYDHTCQISGERMKLPSGEYYCEGHHLKKLGGAHQGPDVISNIILLTPNHHVEFDYGIIGINPIDLTVKHVDASHPLNGQPLAYVRNDLSIEYIKYHWNEIFNK